MSMFEYVAVLTSIIIGLSIAHLLQGVARLIQNPGQTKVYWVHLLWVSNMFFTAVFWWWWEFRFSIVETWTLQLYLFVIIFAVLIYLLCVLLFPSTLDDYTGFEDYFLSRRRWFFGGMAVFELVDLADTRLKGAEHFASLGTEYWITFVPITVLYIFAMFTENRKFHGGFAVFSLLYMISWAFRSAETIL
jgi:hypothetical protein